ncbi:hypothetical protein OMO38_15245 [Chryseobacterium sp. 09-1422]|uniref:DUF5671 domain-containing protein n=1 Tax=Chryseobacterium kimseyorum TaxID=2984028 RepID=A0ABT3I1U4_9FLAO|nr:hypothetical protein [Chryseobacterium kimseyorum]MCW3169880.1 hypothetical protein [Chryseobacterium kimseyorum]
MITSAEEKQIDEYLILNKLPLDILLEVRDHMISQISDLQIYENLSFDQAFFKTKIAWEPEFKMTTYSAFSLEHIPAIFKKIVKANYRKIFKKAISIAAISFVLNLLLIYISPNEETFKLFFKIQNAFFIAVPVFFILSNYKIWKYFKKDFKYRGKIFYSMYQQNLGLIIVSITTMIQGVNGNGKAYTYLFLKEGNSGLTPFFIMLFVPLLLQTLVVFAIINFLEHKKSLQKIQNFIKVSEAD